MEQRSLQYTDAKSNKFWTITLEGTSHTVDYGRVGTAGSQQTKEFPTAEKARTSFEKLIREKLNKGYVEVSQEPDIALESQNFKETLSIVQAPSEIISELLPNQDIVPATLEITRSLDLAPEDWLIATWRPRSPRPRSEPKPFNLEDALKRLRQIQGEAPDRQWQGYFALDWTKAEISIELTREEAQFWFTAMTCDIPGTNRNNTYFTNQHLEDLASALAGQSFTDNLHLSKIIPVLYLRGLFPYIVLPLFNLLPLMELVIAIHNIQFLDDQAVVQYVKSVFVESDYLQRYANDQAVVQYVESGFVDADERLGWNREQLLQAFATKMKSEVWYLLDQLVRGFKTFIWPYLTAAEIQTMRDQLRLVLNDNQQGHQLYYFAAYLGMHNEVQRQIESWSTYPNLHYFRRNQSIEIVFGLSDPQLVNTHVRHLSLGVETPDYIRGWLAHTEYSALDWVCSSILKQYPNAQENLLKTFTQVVKAPEAAPYMLELWLSLKKPQLARQWLEDNPTLAIVGLIPVGAGMGHLPPVQVKPTELTKAAIEFLRSMKRKGYESTLRASLEREAPDIANKVRALVLEPESSYIPFEQNTTPKWLKDGVAAIKQLKRAKPPNWVSPTDLPAIIVGNHCLNEEQVNACLVALSYSTLNPQLLVQHLKAHANPQAMDAFVWSLFDRWLMEGAPFKEKWGMFALGLLGSDAIALKLTPLIRTWPGESQHPRAVLGLECLRTMGTDTALMQINGIAQKIKFKGLQQRAQECIQAIACDRHLTPEQLEDRIIPDCGLDSQGHRVFDFGSRQFHFALGSDLKPLVRDDKNKLQSSLPKIGAKDDAVLATQATADWKLMKKQIGEVVKIQSVRLEAAMVTERRWQVNEFQTLLQQHPLMTHLVQRLVWGGYDLDGELIATFRMAEDQTLADAADQEFDPTNIATVGIVHPLHLNPEVKANWGQTLSDYEIIPPFPQIVDRDTYTLQPEEVEVEEIKRFQAVQIPGVTLARMMESRGWLKGVIHDNGDYSLHYKYFSKANITAVVGEYECMHIAQSSISGHEALDGCCFLVGEHKPYEYPAPGSWYDRQVKADRLSLGEVDPLTLSEVLRDLTAIAAQK